MPSSASILSLGLRSFSLTPDPVNLGTTTEALNVQGPFVKLPWLPWPFALGASVLGPLADAPFASLPFLGGSRPSFLISNGVAGPPIENLTLNTRLSPALSSTSVSFGSAVSGLNANLGDGADSIVFHSIVFGSTILTDETPTSRAGGADSFVASGGMFESKISTGAGRDSLLLSEQIFDSIIETGTGNDHATVKAGSFVSNSSFSLGAGNDTLIFQGSVIGKGGTSDISLGSGCDSLVFAANSFVAGYRIDLGGADWAIDQVQFLAGLDPSNEILITGASHGDVLFIGSGLFQGSYTYDGSNFANASDTLTWLS